ncbi:MAG: hypothetical protein M3R07_04720, partial [Gemmatimonadota bacterium]|nr:hypothetical protein [Gemmatimonadota bacterium]
MHSLISSELAATTSFSGTMVLGFYNSNPIFFEPMVAKAKLMEKRSFTLPMTIPAGLAAGSSLPDEVRSSMRRRDSGLPARFHRIRRLNTLDPLYSSRAGETESFHPILDMQ